MIKLYEIGTYTELTISGRHQQVWYPITWGKFRELTGIPIPENKNHRSLVLFAYSIADKYAKKLNMQTRIHSFGARG